MHLQWSKAFPRNVCLILLAIALSLAGCASPGVTKGTGRVMDPPVELIFYCLLFPGDPACRGIVK